MFTNRKKELRVLESYKNAIEKGQKINLALFGLRRIGKTELFLKFREIYANRDILIVYLNLQKIIPDPINFSRQFSKELLYELGLQKRKNVEEITEIEDLLILATELGELETKYIRNLINIYKQKEINEEDLLERVFKFPQQLAEKQDTKIIYMLDEFQEILPVHKRILYIMRALTEKQTDIIYWVCGSVFSIFDEMFDYKNPFFGQFKRIRLEPFDKVSSCELIDNLLPVRLGEKHKNRIYQFTNGQPYYITAICRRIIQEYALIKKIDAHLINYCFLKETFDDTGAINEHFNYIIDTGLARFKNKDIYKKILFYISEKPANLASISRYLGKPSGEISNYLKALLRTDLIYREKERYYIRDTLFRFWIRKTYLGIDKERLESRSTIDKIVTDLQEKYLKVSTELGTAKEYELKYWLEEELGTKLKNYLKDNIEFDLVGKKKGISYIIEIKWKNRATSYKDLEKFLKKVSKSEFKNTEKRLIFISKSGFTKSAERLATESGIEFMEA